MPPRETRMMRWTIVIGLSIAIQLAIWSTVGPQPWYVSLLAGGVAGILASVVFPGWWRP